MVMFMAHVSMVGVGWSLDPCCAKSAPTLHWPWDGWPCPLDTAAGKVALPLRGEFVQALEKDDPTPHNRHALTVNLPLAIAVYLTREVH